MIHNYCCSGITDGMETLLKGIAKSGSNVGSRAGRVNELTHVGVTLQHPQSRYILNPARKANPVAQIAETMWVLSGRDDIEWLSHYLPRAADFSDDGRTWRGAYGPRLRAWPLNDGSGDVVDQLRHVVDLLRVDPLTRRATMSIYDPARDSKPGKDIPCNNWLHFTSRLGELDLHVATRSNDVIWGWSGINFFEWSTLLEIVASLVDQEVGKLHFSVTSMHLYDHHLNRAAEVIKMASDPITRPMSWLPFNPLGQWSKNDPVGHFDDLVVQWFEAERLIREGHVSKREAIGDFPEPMLRQWLHALDWWWNGTAYEADNALGEALRVGLQPNRSKKLADNALKTAQKTLLDIGQESFYADVRRLHAEKHAAYGDSWKKRGESFSIIPNICRKVDRLVSGAETSDETELDTAIDLMVYMAKYRWWLTENRLAVSPLFTGETQDEIDRVDRLIRWVGARINFQAMTQAQVVGQIGRVLEDMIASVQRGDHDTDLVDALLSYAVMLAAVRAGVSGGTDEYRGADHD